MIYCYSYIAVFLNGVISFCASYAPGYVVIYSILQMFHRLLLILESRTIAIYIIIQIIPNGEEMIPAVMYFANALYNEPLKKF